MMIPVITYSIHLFGKQNSSRMIEESIRTHREIIEAIENHDPNQAEEKMQEHLKLNESTVPALQKHNIWRIYNRSLHIFVWWLFYAPHKSLKIVRNIEESMECLDESEKKNGDYWQWQEKVIEWTYDIGHHTSYVTPRGKRESSYEKHRPCDIIGCREEQKRKVEKNGSVFDCDIDCGHPTDFCNH